MNSIGIKEGTTIRPEPECECVWMKLLVHPPKYKLQKKCRKCIEREKELGDQKRYGY